MGRRQMSKPLFHHIWGGIDQNYYLFGVHQGIPWVCSKGAITTYPCEGVQWAYSKCQYARYIPKCPKLIRFCSANDGWIWYIRQYVYIYICIIIYICMDIYTYSIYTTCCLPLALEKSPGLILVAKSVSSFYDLRLQLASGRLQRDPVDDWIDVESSTFCHPEYPLVN